MNKKYLFLLGELVEKEEEIKALERVINNHELRLTQLEDQK